MSEFEDDQVVPESVRVQLAREVQGDKRQLEGALTRVLAYAVIHQRPVEDADLARLLEVA